MSDTDREAAARWRRVRELFDRLLPLAPEERRERLARELDRSLAGEVEALFAADETGRERLEEPAWSAFAGRFRGAPGALGAPDTSGMSGMSGMSGSWGGSAGPAGGGPLPAGTQLGPWRIEGVAGRGGMGVVYRASRADGAFEREVAIKVVRGAFDSRALVARLEEERRLLAPLDHPGIARLLDAGSTPDGLPYLVLELVDGEPIDRWCDEHASPLSERLSLFLAVCDAVEHAHRRLVLHRDLKPSNILVDRRGEPRLLDFGIAKLLDPATGTDREATLTRAGFRALSLDFASPEQLRGAPLTTASDVFSLGVVLYRLLAGCLPFAGDTDWPEARAAKVATGELTPPSAAARRTAGGLSWRRLRGDLDAIVAKALAADRSSRYGTVTELAEDLRRHLDGRPVRAQRPSAAYRTARFVRRHRAAVAVASLVLLALSGATAFTLRQTAIARRERDLARARFADVRRLAKVFLFDVHDAVAPLSGATTARELLARTGAEYLDRLAHDAGDDPAFLLELATGYERLAEIQGRPFGASRGDARAALASYDKARSLFDKLAAVAYPSPPATAEALARVDLATAESRFAIGEVPQATAHAAAGLARLEPEQPGDSSARRLLRARLRARLGFLSGVAGEVDEGTALVARAVAELEALASTSSTELPVHRALARALTDHGSLVGNSGAPDAAARALVSFERALDLDRRLVAEEPSDLEARRSLIRDHLMVGAGYAMAARLEEALEVYAEGARAAGGMAEADPVDAEAARAHAILLSRQAMALVDLHRPLEARALLAGAVERLAALLRRTPDNIRLALAFAEAAATAGEASQMLSASAQLPAAERARHRADACAAFRRATPIYADLLSRNLLPGTEGEDARSALSRTDALCPPTRR